MFSISSLFFKSHHFRDYRALGLDVHSHLLPGVDDGPDTMEESLKLVNAVRDLGFERAITTPHISLDYYAQEERALTEVFSQWNQVQKDLPEGFIHSVAAEYMMDDGLPARIENQQLLSFAGRRVLFELPFQNVPFNCEQVLFQMTLHGYVPVLAHPERYRFWKKHPDLLDKLVNMGCELQMNILSLTGYYGANAQSTAYKILWKYPVDFLATDCHHLGHVTALRKGLKNRHLARVLANRHFKNADLLAEL